MSKTTATPTVVPGDVDPRFLNAVIRVANLDRTIEFYTECFGLQVLRKGDIPKQKYSYAVLGFGPEDSHFVIYMISEYGVDKYDLGTGFGHFGVSTQDIYNMVEVIRANGGIITREPGPSESGGTTIFAFVQDPYDGYTFELTLITNPTPEPLSQMNFNVVDLDRQIKFYQQGLGMTLYYQYDNPAEQFTMAVLGYGEQSETTALELRYNYGITEYTKGNGYVHVAFSTDDVYKSAEAIVGGGGKIILPPTQIPGTNTKFTSALDPEDWKIVLVENEDSLEELQRISAFV